MILKMKFQFKCTILPVLFAVFEDCLTSTASEVSGSKKKAHLVIRIFFFNLVFSCLLFLFLIYINKIKANKKYIIEVK